MYEELVKRLRILSGTDNITEFDEAADAIVELSMKLHGDEAAIAGMKREIERMVRAGSPRWIPVTERLPEKYTDVLIYYERNAWPDGADYPVRKREIGIGFCGGPDRWHVDHCSGVDGLAWMPLPEPPEGAP